MKSHRIYCLKVSLPTPNYPHVFFIKILRTVRLMGGIVTVCDLRSSSVLHISLHLSMLSCPGMSWDLSVLLVTLDKLVRLKKGVEA